MITMKNLFLTMAAFVATCAFAQLPTRIETFPVSNVRLAASQFKKNGRIRDSTDTSVVTISLP